MKQSVEKETSQNQPFSTADAPINRHQVLSWLKEDIGWLREKARNKNPIKHSIRVNLMRSAIYGCSVLLAGLKDEELELRVEKLEETIKNGLVIPGEKGKSKAR